MSVLTNFIEQAFVFCLDGYFCHFVSLLNKGLSDNCQSIFFQQYP